MTCSKETSVGNHPLSTRQYIFLQAQHYTRAEIRSSGHVVENKPLNKHPTVHRPTGQAETSIVHGCSEYGVQGDSPNTKKTESELAIMNTQ